MVEPRRRSTGFTRIDPVDAYGRHRPRPCIADAQKTRCASCGALLASDNQRGVSSTGLCSPCFVVRDSKETRAYGALINGGNDPIKAVLAITGTSPHIGMTAWRTKHRKPLPVEDHPMTPNPKAINPKVTVGGIAGAASILVVWALGAAGVDVPPEVASAITTVISFAAGYLKAAA